MPNELLRSLKITAENLIEAKRGITHAALYTEIIASYPAAKPSDVNQAISEVVQDLHIVRIEYKLPNQTAYFAFYLPAGSRLV